MYKYKMGRQPIILHSYGMLKVAQSMQSIVSQ